MSRVVLQCVAVRCSVLLCVALCCSVSQCVAVGCSVLQCVAVCCSALRCVIHSYYKSFHTWDHSVKELCRFTCHCVIPHQIPCEYVMSYVLQWALVCCSACCSMQYIPMGWLQSVGSIKLQVSFSEYCLFYRALLQKRPIIFSILLTKATPYQKCDIISHVNASCHMCCSEI